MKKIKITTSFEFDKHFWALIPNINLNFHQRQFTLEIEILCFAVYINSKE